MKLDVRFAVTLPGDKQIVRHSTLMKWLECGKAGYFYMAGDGFTGSDFTFLGSVFHNALEECEYSPMGWFVKAQERQYWTNMRIQMLVDRPDEDYSGNWEHVVNKFLDSKTFYGKTFPQLVFETSQLIGNKGLEIVEAERTIRLEVEGVPGLVYQGTPDLILSDDEGNLIIADVKTSGMWNPIVRGKAPKKQSPDPLQLKYHTQLRHYHWMLGVEKRFNVEDFSKYMLILPANLIPPASEANKKKATGPYGGRGDVMVSAPANHKAIPGWEEDLIEWVTAIDNKQFLRTYPKNFGAIKCGTCFARKPCLEDQRSKEVPDYLKE